MIRTLLESKLLMAIYALLSLQLAAAGVAFYWAFIDIKPPSRLIYQHPKFTSVPVTSREQAKEFEIDEAAPGSTVWRYVEWELFERIHGSIESAWIDGLVYREAKPTLGAVGRHAKSIPHTVPPAAKQDDFIWSQRILYKRNLITTVEIQYPSIRLRVIP